MGGGEIVISFHHIKLKIPVRKERNKYRMLKHIYGILKKKNGTDEPSFRAGIKR